MNNVWIWVGIIVLLCVIEAETISLVSIWFIVSAIVSLILALFKIDFSICFGVFVILGTLLMITTRKAAMKLLKVEKVNTNLDRIIGSKGIVTEDISKDKNGEVKVDGKRWSAYSDENLPEGTMVKIVKIDSVKLSVKKWEE